MEKATTQKKSVDTVCRIQAFFDPFDYFICFALKGSIGSENCNIAPFPFLTVNDIPESCDTLPAEYTIFFRVFFLLPQNHS